MISRSRGSKADRSTDIAASPKRLGEYDQHTSLVWISLEPLVYNRAPFPTQDSRRKSPDLFPLRPKLIRPDSDSRLCSESRAHARVPLFRQPSPKPRPDPREAPLRCLDGGCDFVPHDP